MLNIDFVKSRRRTPCTCMLPRPAGADVGRFLITNRVAELWRGWDALRVPDDVRVSAWLTTPAAELTWRFSWVSGPAAGGSACPIRGCGLPRGGLHG